MPCIQAASADLSSCTISWARCHSPAARCSRAVARSPLLSGRSRPRSCWPAHQDADALARGRHVGAAEQRGEGRRAAGLGDEAQRRPRAPPARAGWRVAHQHDALDVRLGDREHQLADALRRERVGRDPAGLGIDRLARRERLRQRRRALGLDPDDARLPRVPGRDAADEAAAAHRDQQRVEVRGLARQLEPERALAEQRLLLIEGMHRQGAGAAPPRPRSRPARRRSGRRPPRGRRRSRGCGCILAGEDTVGTKMCAGTPSRIAA